MEPQFVLHGAATLSSARLPLVAALHKVSFPTSSPDAENLIYLQGWHSQQHIPAQRVKDMDCAFLSAGHKRLDQEFYLALPPKTKGLEPLIEQDKEIYLLEIKEMCCSPR